MEKKRERKIKLEKAFKKRNNIEQKKVSKTNKIEL